MMPSSPLYCDACGAANQTQATRCWACGQLLAASTEHSVSASSPPAQQPAPPPALLVGRYRIIGMIGTGGFGAVYQAQDLRRNDAPVAIKSINLHHLSPEQIIEATDTFNREMLLLSDLEHPNLPRIHDHFTDQEHWYLAMDFIQGETLEEYLSHTRKGYLPVAEVLAIGMQLCTVLGYLHTRQPPIIFRDVKPANVMRTPSGQLYLIDFGIARRFRPGQKHDTTVLGSPGYAPPEQYGRAQTTVQSDIYSLGATLQTLLTGKDPLEPISGYGPPYPQGQVVPVALELLLAQMLDTDARKRPASMEAVKQALQQIQDERLFVRSGQPVRPSQQTAPPAGTARQILQTLAAHTAQHAGTARQILQTLAAHTAQHAGTARQILQTLATHTARRAGTARQILQTLATHTARRAGTARQILQTLATHTARRGISRRTVIVGLAGLALGGIALVRSLSSQGSQIIQNSQTFPQVSPDPHLLYTYRGHSFLVHAVAWSPDGRRIASGSGDNTVQVWDAADGGNVYTYRGHSFLVNAVAWSPDGRRIASGSGDNTVQVWDAVDGGHVYTYRGHSFLVNAVAWSPDGRRIASASWDETVQVWDAADGGHVFSYKGHADVVDAVAWSPDGKRIASASWDKTVQVWDAADGGNVYTYRGHSFLVHAVAWSPDSRRIASGGSLSKGGGGDTTVQVWDAADGGNVYTYRGHSFLVNAVAWSPDGRRIASGSGDNTVQVWDAVDEGHVYTYRGHAGVVWTVAWSPDGKRIASGSLDKTVQVWDAERF